MELFAGRQRKVVVSWIALTRRNEPRIVVIDGSVADPNTQVALSRLPEPTDLIEQQAVELRLLDSAAPADRANRLQSAARSLNSAGIKVAAIAEHASNMQAEELASEFFAQAQERFAQGVQATREYLMTDTILDSEATGLGAIETNLASFAARFWTSSQALALTKQATQTLEKVGVPARNVEWTVVRQILDQLAKSLR